MGRDLSQHLGGPEMSRLHAKGVEGMLRGPKGNPPKETPTVQTPRRLAAFEPQKIHLQFENRKIHHGTDAILHFCWGVPSG